MGKLKILVGCPTYWGKAYCLKEYVERVKKLTYSNYEVLLIDNSKNERYLDEIQQSGLRAEKSSWCEDPKERIIASRNVLRQKILDEGYDYFLSLEQDLLPPVDVIERLLNHHKEIVTGVYYKEGVHAGKKVPYALLYIEQQGKLVLAHPERLKGKELLPINACGLGCILIHRAVLEKISFRKPTSGVAQDDMMFCYDAQKAGFTLYADPTVICEHLHKDWKESEEELKDRYV
ncbi:MAG: glycosyltransferase family A protein [Nanoarchaeota archaeon]